MNDRSFSVLNIPWAWVRGCVIMSGLLHTLVSVWEGVQAPMVQLCSPRVSTLLGHIDITAQRGGAGFRGANVMIVYISDP